MMLLIFIATLVIAMLAQWHVKRDAMTTIDT
jgi:hypothetical protein